LEYPPSGLAGEPTRERIPYQEGPLVAEDNDINQETGPESGPSDCARRGFLKQAVLGGAAALAASGAVLAQEGSKAAHRDSAAEGPGKGATALADASAAKVSGGVPASDYMIDLLRSLGIEQVAFLPGDTFRGLHESVINHGMVTSPRMGFVPCMHEEMSVAVCQGYAKISGKPMVCIVHSVVGLQHATMAIYNSWVDRVPVFIITGQQTDPDKRLGEVEWDHSVFDGPEIVRDFTKYDDTPPTLRAFSESAVRAYKIAMTPPNGPVILAVDTLLQLKQVPQGELPAIPRLPRIIPPQGEESACEEIAQLLVAAEYPVLYANRHARTPAGLANLIELAETLQAPVVDGGGRMNFPWRHPLNQTADARALMSRADVILGLEPTDFYDATRAAPPNAQKISITSTALYSKSNYQDLQRFTDVDIAVAADSEATVPVITAAVRRQLSPTRRAALKERGARLARAHAAALKRARDAAAVGWNVSPITTARMCMELYGAIRKEDWSLVNGTFFQSLWPQRLWSADKFHRYIGGSGGAGLGYQPGATMGAAIANQRHGRLTVAIGGDGDLMVTPSWLWTAAHNRIPLLYVVHNNRAYHEEIMWLQAVAGQRQRGMDRCHIGTTIDHPYIDYAKLAQSMGVYGEGPIMDPNALGPALERAISVVKRGEPALVDVVAQGR
jgi:acetolactate synthase-1/2/3 large subunit